MQIFTHADYLIMAFMLLSVLVSLIRGFIREAVSLATWILAIWLALHFTTPLAVAFENVIKSTTIRYVIAGAVIIIISLFMGGLLAYLTGEIVDRTGLSGTDRVLGVLFGAARGILFIAVLLLVARLTPLTDNEYWKKSLLIPYFLPVETWLHDMLPESMSSKFELRKDNP